MKNPFESGHIKNYLLFYAAVVLIMVLFFATASLFHEVPEIEQKIFDIETSVEPNEEMQEAAPTEVPTSNKIILLDKAY